MAIAYRSGTRRPSARRSPRCSRPKRGATAPDDARVSSPSRRLPSAGPEPSSASSPRSCPKLGRMRTAVVTGSSGLIGSEMVAFLDVRGWRTEGIDNNMRRDFFGQGGDTRPNLEALLRSTKHFAHHDLDVR